MVVETQSRVYASSALDKGPSYYEYSTYKLAYGDIDNYTVLEPIGRGKYSQVFKGRAKKKDLCIIKVLKPVREKKVCREAKILHTLRDTPSVVQMIDMVKDRVSGTRSFIFKYQVHVDTRSLFKELQVADIRYYIGTLLRALDRIHSMGIMHRDIKPHNLIINPETKEIRIIDWGLAEYYLPGTHYSVGVASMHFKAPELLVGQKYYDYSLDIWSLGCVLCEILFSRTPMFNGSSNEDQLVKIVKVLGTDDLALYLKKQEILLPLSTTQQLKSCPRNKEWPRTNALALTKEEKKDLLELVEGMLKYNHQERLTAKECLALPFFSKAN